MQISTDLGLQVFLAKQYTYARRLSAPANILKIQPVIHILQLPRLQKSVMCLLLDHVAVILKYLATCSKPLV